jgi:hypothetical protein
LKPSADRAHERLRRHSSLRRSSRHGSALDFVTATPAVIPPKPFRRRCDRMGPSGFRAPHDRTPITVPRLRSKYDPRLSRRFIAKATQRPGAKASASQRDVRAAVSNDFDARRLLPSIRSTASLAPRRLFPRDDRTGHDPSSAAAVRSPSGMPSHSRCLPLLRQPS